METIPNALRFIRRDMRLLRKRKRDATSFSAGLLPSFKLGGY